MSAFHQLTCRGVSHTPKCTNWILVDVFGRMQYAPTRYFINATICNGQSIYLS